MGENTLVWIMENKHLNRIFNGEKFVDELGYVYNSKWSLHVNCGVGFFVWRLQFSLNRENVSDSVTVNVKLFNDSLLSEKEVTFTKESTSMEVGNMLFPFHSKPKVEFHFKQNGPDTNSSKEVIIFVKKDNFREDMLSLLQNERISDVTLQCGSETVHAHKAILCARSPVFGAMFENDMQESKTNTVTIDDMDSSVFQSWIRFVYGSEVKITSVNFACDLLDAAEKYQMKGLKEICIEYLESVLSPENAVQLLEVAELYDDQFKTKVVAYISDHLSAVVPLKEWKDLKARKPVLALEVYSYKENQ